MSSILTVLLLTFFQFATGFGLLSVFRIWLKPAMMLSLSVLLGIGVFSFIPFVLQLFYIPLTGLNVFLLLVTTCIIFNIKLKTRLRSLKRVWKESRFSVRLYELPALLIIAFIVFVSVWRCFYFPPTSRDFTSGPEVLAEYAVREKTMLNSVFSLHLETYNNHFKSPFLASLQIIYKYAGFPFGQVWLCNVFICFLIFLYHALSITLHRLIAGLLIVFFLAIPEMYAYTFMVLFDYSNTVFFFLAAYFFFSFLRTGKKNQIAFAGLLTGIASYIRSETLVLAGLLFLPMVWRFIKRRDTFGSMLGSGMLFLLPAALAYFLTAYIYINFYIPIHYDIPGLVNPELSNLRPLMNRFLDVNTELIFSAQGMKYYGYFFFIFLAVLTADIIYSRKPNRQAVSWLYAVLVVFFGLIFLGYLLPLLDLHNSTKRGLFKIFPMMLLYMANSGLLMHVSEKIKSWELAR